MTPDWSGAPAAVPYADYGNPQSLNLYAYVGNNPVNGVDADGHCGGQQDGTYSALACAMAGTAQGNWADWDAENFGEQNLGWGSGFVINWDPEKLKEDEDGALDWLAAIEAAHPKLNNYKYIRGSSGDPNAPGWFNSMFTALNSVDPVYIVGKMVMQPSLDAEMFASYKDLNQASWNAYFAMAMDPNVSAADEATTITNIVNSEIGMYKTGGVLASDILGDLDNIRTMIPNGGAVANEVEKAINTGTSVSRSTIQQLIQASQP